MRRFGKAILVITLVLGGCASAWMGGQTRSVAQTAQDAAAQPG